MTVQTETEYFFVMAASLTDQRTWFYVHQTQNDLCLHKMDIDGNDEIGQCAQRLQWMASGNVENMPEQLYVCHLTFCNSKKGGVYYAFRVKMPI